MKNRRIIYIILTIKECTGGDGLVYSDIEGSINNPNKVTCCGTYVSIVLYKAGYFSEEEINKTAYNSAPYLSLQLQYAQWEKISGDKELLQPGDVVFTVQDGKTYHVQIYMGDDSWYTSGNTEDIQSEGVIVDPDWENAWDGWYAFRPPQLETKEPETVVLNEN